MGASESKLQKNKEGGKRSPTEEKHTSADSSTPLANKAAELDIDRSTITDKHASLGEKSMMGRSRTNTAEGPLPSSPDEITPAPLQIHELEGHSNVSRPPAPPRLRLLSELIDPADIPMDGHVRSPSGSLLAPEQYLVHPGRPRSIRERQEEIREKVRTASRLGMGAENAAEEEPKEAAKKDGKKKKEPKKKSPKKKRACSNCFCC